MKNKPYQIILRQHFTIGIYKIMSKRLPKNDLLLFPIQTTHHDIHSGSLLFSQNLNPRIYTSTQIYGLIIKMELKSGSKNPTYSIKVGSSAWTHFSKSCISKPFVFWNTSNRTLSYLNLNLYLNSNPSTNYIGKQGCLTQIRITCLSEVL